MSGVGEGFFFFSVSNHQQNTDEADKYGAGLPFQDAFRKGNGGDGERE